MRAGSLAVLLVSLLVAGAASAEPLRWASDAQSGAPFVFHDPADQSRLTGFETDIMAALGRRIGSTPVFVQNDWDGLIPGLQRGLYDVVIDGIEITPEHRAAVDFSEPYYPHRRADRGAPRCGRAGQRGRPARARGRHAQGHAEPAPAGAGRRHPAPVLRRRDQRVFRPGERPARRGDAGRADRAVLRGAGPAAEAGGRPGWRAVLRHRHREGPRRVQGAHRLRPRRDAPRRHAASHPAALGDVDAGDGRLHRRPLG